MIRDYFRFPHWRDARPYQGSRERHQEPDRQSSLNTRDRSDWENWRDAEALRGSPRSPRQRGRDFEEGYGYGDTYFGDDQRLARPRFQEGWEGSYRSTPWTLGAEHISPGLHGPYGGSPPYDDPYLEDRPFDEDSLNAPHGNAELRNNPYRYSRQSRGRHQGLGPQSYTRADERIREDVCDRLTDHPEIDARQVDVTVENGVVLLQGTVSDRAMKYDAEDCSWYVSGVKDVDNRIRVDRSQESQQRERTFPPR